MKLNYRHVTSPNGPRVRIWTPEDEAYGMFETIQTNDFLALQAATECINKVMGKEHITLEDRTDEE
jgi:hypothetical protein